MGGDPAFAPLRTSDEEVRKLKAEGERREAQLKKQAAEEMKVKATNKEILYCHKFDHG